MNRRLLPTLAALAFVGGSGLLSVTAAPAAAHHHRARGDIRVFAHVPAPGEPSYSLLGPHHRVYVGTFEDVSGSDTSPSKVFAYSRHGTLKRTYVVRGQTPGKAHGVQVATRDRAGRLYLLDQAPARIVVLNVHHGRARPAHQGTWATFPDVAPCKAGQTTNCSNTVADNPPEPDYAAWLPDGSLLVTDYAQQLVWRVPAHRHGVRKAQVWLNDKRLDGEQFGPAGIVMLPGDHRHLLLTVATGGVTTVDPTDDASKGRLYRIDLTHGEQVRRLVQLWSSPSATAPDGFAVSRHHRHVYIAMAGPSGNNMVEVARDRSGTWRQVFTVPGASQSSPVPWDTPTSVTFLGHRVLVTNQAYFTDDASHWVLFDVRVGERGAPLYIPRRAGR